MRWARRALMAAVVAFDGPAAAAGAAAAAGGLGPRCELKYRILGSARLKVPTLLVLLCALVPLAAQGAGANLHEPPSGAQAEPSADAPPAPAEDDIVARSTFTLTSGGGSRGYECVVRRGQDAAAAAVAFAEEHALNVDGVLQIAQHLVGQVESAAYEPPKELRLRTAGAHKKRAESLAKEGVHDEAAEHLARALMRPGLETDIAEADWSSFLAEVLAPSKLRGQDASEQVFAFCAANGLHSADEVSKLGGLVSGRLEEAGHAREEATSAAALVVRGARQRREGGYPPPQVYPPHHLPTLTSRQRREGDYSAAGAAFARALHHAGAGELSKEQLAF
ncbi:hypothetical protein EMIHUDRAFT_234643 [Emiliania huxleyi CCMP1516]|uniref:Uncharacterized protein n=2 Tax=Emiliania huxleyi TaxID=2903 RepID=A0A0D3JZ62_EMIH1|nr:hypothetical protein EMIHUDRAFT_234643 [Emiliania huxleyi CCMP1516]EOD28797.1 hypothetical protein EMIHUDRAFT_234643 [Emiliania huxleyi CCMP1516]|eukprot:XP_005781226.1 hypothetical protein EMIHUDRAFT_234643 [Emiliania huxleyi CCMP1516]